MYESFNYDPALDSGYLPNKAATAAGLTGTWGSLDSFAVVTAGSLSAPANSGAFAASDNQLRLYPGTTPSANTALSAAIATHDTTVYFSFVGAIASGSAVDRASGVRFYNGSGGTVLNLGRTNTGFWGVSDGLAFNSSAVSASTTAFVVYKATFGAAGAGNDTVSLFVNPGNLDEASAVATATWTGLSLSDVDINRIELRAPGNASSLLDEIRVGTTWSDVVAIPESSPGALAGLGAVALAGLIRRRRG